MIRSYLEQLSALDEASVCRIAFLSEPSRGKLTQAEKEKLYVGAAEEAKTKARFFKRKYGDVFTVQALLDECGACVREVSQPPDEQYSLFAYFERPNVIVLNSPTVELAQELIDERELHDLLGSAPVREVLLCHELYHMLMDKDKAAFTGRRHMPVLKAGGLRICRTIPCLEEIAAMEFAKEILGLPCTPYAYNILMLYPFFPQQAEKLLQDYLQQFDE